MTSGQAGPGAAAVAAGAGPDGSGAGDVQRAWRREPARIGPYQVVGRLGSGAMGRVYLGRSAAGRLVAVKTIRPEYAEESDFRTRFAREVAAARRVSGVFTAAVVAADPDADVPWLATAYVPAPSLDELVRRCGPLPVPAVRWLAAGCAEALESIHEAGLVHRDLKPSNVLVSPDGPRVIDFGVARAVERIQLTAAQGSLGTPAYMAPEQARDTRRATSASDVFSLGSTLVFAATGHAPYRGETITDLLVRLATERPDLTGLPPQLLETVAGCLERDPSGRPTPTELVAQLAPFVNSEMGHEPGRSTLPAAALAVIEEHRQGPLSPARAAGGHAEDTIGSHVLIGPGDHDRPEAAPAEAGRLAAARAEEGPTDAGRLAGPADAGRLDAGPAGSGPADAGRLDAGPAGSGPADSQRAPGMAANSRRLPFERADSERADAEPAGSRVPAAGRSAVPPAVAPAADWRLRITTVVVAIGVVTALVVVGYLLGSQRQAGETRAPVQGSSLDQGGRPLPPDGGPRPPPGSDYDVAGGPPGLVVNQTHGDGDTTFVLHGANWPPGARITVRLAGGPVSSVVPVVDRAGSFNYAINQTRELFAGRLPPGTYRVQVSTPGGPSAEATFSVGP